MAKKLRSLIDKNFLEYASYVIKDRAIPHLNDGFKPVQRRILHTLHGMDDGKFHKVANVVGRSMQFHPHGDASIYSALVVLANKDLFIDKQGNFGNLHTGDSASAARYIECRLTPLAKEVLFNQDLTHFEPSYDGRNQEPVTLPAKIPVLLMQGAEGIAVGMSTSILPHNFQELLKAQISILRDEPFQILPDFPTGGIMDASQYEDGNGKVAVRAKVEIRDNKHLVIREIPYGTNTEKLITSIENAIKKNRIKVSAIQDYTAENVEIELTLPRGVHAGQMEDALYAFTDCQISHSVQMIIINEETKPQQMTVSDVLRHNTYKLMEDLRKEYEIELDRLGDNLHYKTLEQIFIEHRIYKHIEEKDTYAKVIAAVYQGFEPYLSQLTRDLSDEDVERLLQIRIKRISRYDMNKNRKEIQDILVRIDQVNALLAKMTSTTIKYLKNLLKKYGASYERRTEIQDLETVNRRAVAVQDLKVGYDPESGYVGTGVKINANIQCSQFHKLLIITPEYYKVIGIPDKLYIKEKILLVEKLDKTKVYNCMYREQTTGLTYIKRFRVEKFILEKAYSFIGDNSKILVFTPNPPPRVKVYYPRTARTRITQEIIDFSEQLIKGPSARGNRVSSKPVTSARLLMPKTEPELA